MMLLSSGSCTLHFAFGETNMIAHRLTCVALSLDEALRWYGSPPDIIHDKDRM